MPIDAILNGDELRPEFQSYLHEDVVGVRCVENYSSHRRHPKLTPIFIRGGSTKLIVTRKSLYLKINSSL